MNTELPSTAEHQEGQVPENVKISALQARFPGVRLRFVVSPKNGWHIHARGPQGSCTMSAPNPLRGKTLDALCRLVSEDNTSPLGGAA